MNTDFWDESWNSPYFCPSLVYKIHRFLGRFWSGRVPPVLLCPYASVLEGLCMAPKQSRPDQVADSPPTLALSVQSSSGLKALMAACLTPRR
jgi:hypothetical protein